MSEKCKWYFINLWYAIKGRKYPSGLDGNTWYEIHEFYRPKNENLSKRRLLVTVFTDRDGHITPFEMDTTRYRW